jgi:ketopantoate reductase
MTIMVLGSGVIGTTYGFLFAEAGHDVRYVVRPELFAHFPRTLEVRLLDGRYRPPQRRRTRETLMALSDAGRGPAGPAMAGRRERQFPNTTSSW